MPVIPVPSIAETASSLDGLRRLVRLDADAIRCFNATAEGFWNSFIVAFITLPLYLLQSVVHYVAADLETHWLRFLLMETLTFALGWLAFPVLMIHVTQALDVFDRFLAYFVTYHWFQLLVAAALLPLSVLQAAGLLPDGLAALLFLMLVSAFLMYGWFIAHKALGVTMLTAAGIVILDLVLSLIINGLAESLMTS